MRGSCEGSWESLAVRFAFNDEQGSGGATGGEANVEQRMCSQVPSSPFNSLHCRSDPHFTRVLPPSKNNFLFTTLRLKVSLMTSD